MGLFGGLFTFWSQDNIRNKKRKKTQLFWLRSNISYLGSAPPSLSICRPNISRGIRGSLTQFIFAETFRGEEDRGSLAQSFFQRNISRGWGHVCDTIIIQRNVSRGRGVQVYDTFIFENAKYKKIRGGGWGSWIYYSFYSFGNEIDSTSR